MIVALLAGAMLLAQTEPAASTATTTPATAPTDTSAPAAAKSKTASADVSGVTVTGRPQDNPKAVVCRTEQVLGSMFPKKVCASKEAFAERRREDQAYVRESQALRPYKSN